VSEPQPGTTGLRTAVIGAGWAGLAAAVCAHDAGHAVTVWEAARAWGGRARALDVHLPDGRAARLDNGQHILIGAYSDCLRLMRRVGLDPSQLLLRLPLELPFPDGGGIRFARWPAPLDVLAGILGARGWAWADKFALLRTAMHWRLAGFRCPRDHSVAQLCRTLPARVQAELIEPLCLSALNTPPDLASGQVFLRVLRDALFGEPRGADLLLPRTDLSTLFPDAAARWLAQRGAAMHQGVRIRRIERDGQRWCIQGEPFDRVILATAAHDAAHVLRASLEHVGATDRPAIARWIDTTAVLHHAAIATVYASGDGATLARPMLALRCATHQGQVMPAQFVFDRGQLGGPRGLLAFVVSASTGGRETLQSQVMAQARTQLGLQLRPVTTVVEKRATLSCTPGLVRPGQVITPGLLACGDYVDGPYPSTLEGAVRSAIAAIRSSASGS
jgi:squalene-associated FAD-dependent desaturase